MGQSEYKLVLASVAVCMDLIGYVLYMRAEYNSVDLTVK
jgi:hypothetical protein